MEKLLSISRRLESFISFIGKLAGWLAVPMILIIMTDVFYRRFGGQGSVILQELEWHLHGALFLLCFGYAYLSDTHVRIELVRDKLRPRTRAWIELIGVVLFLVPYTILFMWYSVPWAIDSFTRGEVSSALTGLTNRWVIKSVLPLGMLLLLLSGIAIFCRTLVFLFGPAHMRTEAGTHVGAHHADLTEVDLHEIEEARQENPKEP